MSRSLVVDGVRSFDSFRSPPGCSEAEMRFSMHASIRRVAQTWGTVLLGIGLAACGDQSEARLADRVDRMADQACSQDVPCAFDVTPDELMGLSAAGPFVEQLCVVRLSFCTETDLACTTARFVNAMYQSWDDSDFYYLVGYLDDGDLMIDRVHHASEIIRFDSTVSLPFCVGPEEAEISIESSDHPHFMYGLKIEMRR